jgi:alpha-amylase
LAIATLVDASVRDGNLVHLFEWSWTDVALECEQWLGPKGFQAVQISPPMEHIKGSQWWTRYQPVSYNLTSRSGTRDQFVDMCARCNAVGVAVIADAVINHMAASPSGTAYGTAGTAFYGRAFEPYSYDPSLMHHLSGNENSNCAVTNYNDANNVQQCDLVGLVDLDTENPTVSQRIGDYLTELVNAGVGGLRLDAAKHIKPASVAAFLAKGPAGLYNFQEVIYGAGEPITPEQYVANGEVTEFRYGTNLYDNFHEGVKNKMIYMSTFGEAWGMLPSGDAVAFTDNHDTQRTSSNVLTYKNGQYYNLANYFMLAHPYGHPSVMSSYYFTDNDAGPPGVPVHDGGTLRCNDGVNWVCEHRRVGIAGLVAFRLSAAGTPAANWQYDSVNANRVAFARGSAGFFALNMDPNYTWAPTLTVPLPDGTYCDVIASADCSATVKVSGGKATLFVGTLNAVAFHIGSKLN